MRNTEGHGQVPISFAPVISIGPDGRRYLRTMTYLHGAGERERIWLNPDGTLAKHRTTVMSERTGATLAQREGEALPAHSAFRDLLLVSSAFDGSEHHDLIVETLDALSRRA